MRVLFAIGLAAGFLGGCAGSPSTPQTGSLEQLMAREASLPPIMSYRVDDGTFAGTAHAKAAPRFDRGDTFWYGAFDIGTEAPIECYFYDQDVAPAESLALITEAYFERFAKQGYAGERSIDSARADHVGAWGYLSSSWLFRANETLYGIKLKSATRDFKSIVCIHSETGLASTFDTFFRGLLETFEIPKPNQWEHEEVALITVQDLPVGYVSQMFRRDADGDYETIVFSSMVIPDGPSTLHVSDEYQKQWSRPDGTVINDYVLSIEGDSLSQLSLIRGEAGWVVEGEMQGQKIDLQFPADDPLVSIRGELLLLQDLASDGDAREVEYSRWLGSLNPGAPTTHTIRSHGNAQVDITAGPVSLSGMIDEHGIVAADTKLGHFELKLERVYVDGAL